LLLDFFALSLHPQSPKERVRGSLFSFNIYGAAAQRKRGVAPRLEVSSALQFGDTGRLLTAIQPEGEAFCTLPLFASHVCGAS